MSGISKDLMTWEHLPIALAPDEKGMIFSGSAVVDWNDTTGFFNGKPGLVVIFTHHNDSGMTQRRKLVGYTGRRRASNLYRLDEQLEICQ